MFTRILILTLASFLLSGAQIAQSKPSPVTSPHEIIDRSLQRLTIDGTFEGRWCDLEVIRQTTLERAHFINDWVHPPIQTASRCVLPLPPEDVNENVG
ncbi:MAG: hypothetical protein GTO41_00915 [Burkholderiales bacterium]|nr:hypothetical protein [Burkholderiales bacterium]